MTDLAVARHALPVPHAVRLVPGRLSRRARAGEAMPLYYFGRHLVLWRDEDGAAHLNDAFCPHLGAHLGHGGMRRGLRARVPVPRLEVRRRGRQHRHPLQRPHQPARPGIRTYPVRRAQRLRHGVVPPRRASAPHVGDRRARPRCRPTTPPSGPISALRVETPRIAGAGRERRRLRRTSATCTTPRSCPRSRTTRPTAPRRDMRSVQKFPTPRGVVDGRIDVDNQGPGFGVDPVRGIVDTLPGRRGTPIDEQTAARCASTSRSAASATTTTTSSVGKAFVERGLQAVRGGHADLGEQGPPRAPGAGRHRRPVHEVPQVVRAVLRRAHRRRAAPCFHRRTGPRRWTRPPPRPPPAPSTAADDSGQPGELADQRRSDAAALASARASDSAFSRTLLDKVAAGARRPPGPRRDDRDRAEQVATDAVQEVVAVERSLREQLVDQLRASAGPMCMMTATARLSSTTGDGMARASAP